MYVDNRCGGHAFHVRLHIFSIPARAHLQVPSVQLPVHRMRPQAGPEQGRRPRLHGSQGGVQEVGRARDHGFHDPHWVVFR